MARVLTGEIIANKATPLCVIDRLQGRPHLPTALQGAKPLLKYKQFTQMLIHTHTILLTKPFRLLAVFVHDSVNAHTFRQAITIYRKINFL